MSLAKHKAFGETFGGEGKIAMPSTKQKGSAKKEKIHVAIAILTLIWYIRKNLCTKWIGAF